MGRLKDLLSKNFFLGLGIVLFFGIFFGVGLGYLYDNYVTYADKDIADVPKSYIEESEVLIKDNTTIIFNKYFSKADKSIENIVRAQEDLIGLNEEEIKAYYKDYNIDKFTEEEVILSINIDSYPVGYYKISTITQGGEEYIAAYSFDENGKEILYKETYEPLYLLFEEDIQNIKEGIIVMGEENLHITLQNYID